LIGRVTGRPVTTFCYPFGAKNDSATEVLKNAGFKAACVINLYDGSIKVDPYSLKRIKISTNPKNIPVFRVKISGYYTWFKAHRWKKRG